MGLHKSRSSRRKAERVKLIEKRDVVCYADITVKCTYGSLLLQTEENILQNVTIELMHLVI